MSLANEIRKFQDCLREEIDSIDIVPGTLLYCRDNGDMFYDTLEGNRIPLGEKVKFFDTESDRNNFFDYDSEKLYVVRETKKLYAYSGGWIPLGGGNSTSYKFYLDIENIEIKAGEETTITDSRINEACTATFVPIPSLYDLFESASVVCGEGSASVTLEGEYDMIGTLKITGVHKESGGEEAVL